MRSGRAPRAAHRHLATVALLLVLASCSSSGGSDTSSPDDEVEVEEMGEFAVVGRTIVDPFGEVFVPHGANIGTIVIDRDGNPVWLFTLGGNDVTEPAAVEAVQAWNWNTLRLNARCTEIEANEFNSAWGNDEMLAAIDQVVDTYTPLGIVVMIECHDLTGQSPQTDSSVYAQVEQFWLAAAERYRDNTYVWFNHLNEFHAPSDAVTDEQDDSYWQSIVDDAYATIASTGARNLLVFDLPNYGNDLGVFSTAAIRSWAATKCNTIWSWHAYGGLVPEAAGQSYSFDQPDEAAFRAEVSSLVARISDADLPLMVGELGYDWNAERKNSNFAWASERLGAMTALDILPSEGYGIVVWHANGDSAMAMTYSLKAADDLTFAQPQPGEQLSELGQRFWDLSQERKAEGSVAAPSTVTCQR